MTVHETKLPEREQAVVDAFVAACRVDDRVVAAILGGSHARGEADAYSDLDFGLITTDEAYERFLADREQFAGRLGELLFAETFDSENFLFFILQDGTECELGIGCESAFTHIQSGPYRVLMDKRGILEGADFTWTASTPDGQTETVRRQIVWFWHDLSHFTAAIGRGQLWWAQGQLEDLRRYCVNLARLSQDSTAKPETYWKVELSLSAGQLAPLIGTCVPLERDAMLDAALTIVGVYRELARPLAEAHGILYPDRLDRIMTDRLERLCTTREP